MLRRCAYLALFLVCLAMASVSHGAENKIYELHIPSSKASDALKILARQTKHSLLFQNTEIESVMTKAIKGHYTLSQALDALLDGTNLSGGLTQRGVITISLLPLTQPDKSEENMNKSHRKSTLLSGIASVFSALLGTSLATAQDTDDPDAGFTLEEIVVTAQKRAESIIDVPISIVTVTDDFMKKTGVRQMRDVAEFVPNMSFTSGNDNATAVRIRGVGATTRNIGFDTRVGVYLDGVYLGQSPAQNMDILDLERVEVLRGPQGTLFGKNTVAGAINLISKQPDDQLMMEVRGEYGNFKSHRLSAIINLPISDNLFTRFSISDNQREGYVTNLFDGTKFNGRDGISLRGQVRYEGEGFDINIAADRLSSKRVSFNGEAITNTFGLGSTDPGAPERLEINVNTNNHEERSITGVTGTLQADLGGDYAVKLISAYRDTHAERIQDTDYSALDMLHVEYPDGYKQFSQELQIISPDSDRFKYVAGLYYYHQEGTSERHIPLGADVGVLFSLLAPPLAPAAPLFVGAAVDTFGDVTTTSWAGFVNGSYDITDRLTLGFGARYTYEKKTVDWALLGDVVNIGFPFPLATVFGVSDGRTDVAGPGVIIDGRSVAAVQDSNSYKNFSPTINVTYALSEDVNVYAKYSSAFKSGGFNLDFVSVGSFIDGLDFDQETVDAYEVGIKGDVLDNRLRFNLVAFQSDFKDYQLNQFVDLGNGLSSITIRNAAKVRTKGIEAEVTLLATENLLLAGSVGFLDTAFLSFPGGGSSRHPGGVGADLSGNELPEAPSFTAAVSAQYNYPIESLNAEGIIRFDWTYSGSNFTSEDNVRVARPGSTVPYGYNKSWSLLNGRIGLESDKNWAVYLWARNLLNKEYSSTNLTDFFGTVINFPAEPRMYGVEVSYQF